MNKSKLADIMQKHNIGAQFALDVAAIIEGLGLIRFDEPKDVPKDDPVADMIATAIWRGPGVTTPHTLTHHILHEIRCAGYEVVKHVEAGPGRIAVKSLMRGEPMYLLSLDHVIEALGSAGYAVVRKTTPNADVEAVVAKAVHDNLGRSYSATARGVLDALADSGLITYAQPPPKE